jgi:hypothetical protein
MPAFRPLLAGLLIALGTPSAQAMVKVAVKPAGPAARSNAVVLQLRMALHSDAGMKLDLNQPLVPHMNLSPTMGNDLPSSLHMKSAIALPVAAPQEQAAAPRISALLARPEFSAAAQAPLSQLTTPANAKQGAGTPGPMAFLKAARTSLGEFTPAEIAGLSSADARSLIDRIWNEATPGDANVQVPVGRNLMPAVSQPYPVRLKRPGVKTAITENGIELPVIDLTLEEFKVNKRRKSAVRSTLTALAIRTLGVMPRFVRQAIASRSYILSDFLSEADFNGAEPTYWAKLGRMAPGSLLDRIAARITQPVRKRLDQTSDQEAAALKNALAGVAPTRGARLVSIAGGSAVDTVNALLKIQRDQPQLLAERRITITVLDARPEAPGFGRRALSALQQPGAPLNGVDVRFEYIPYDWSKPQVLQRWMKLWARGGDVLVGASEGGLFHYGSDEDIVANLKALHAAAPADFRFVGTAYWDAVRADPSVRALKAASDVAWKLRGIKGDADVRGMEQLAGRAGWEIERASDENTHFAVFTLKKKQP